MGISYDGWLEEPYQRRAARDEAINDWAESGDADESYNEYRAKNGPECLTREDWEQSLDAAEAYDDWMEDQKWP